MATATVVEVAPKDGAGMTDVELGQMPASTPAKDKGTAAEPSQLRHIGKEVNFSFEDVRYSVPVKGSEKPKVLLHGVSGYAEGGELIGIMGPSGAGKSTLLDALAGRLASGTQEGVVRHNGVQVKEKTFRHVSAYVPQSDESLMGSLTVAETLQFSAELSLPQGTPAEDKRQRVEDILAELGLTDARDVMVGNLFVKGISGGQKRRLSMGVEMIELPEVMFLDEPTSGLDSSAAYRAVASCRRIARTGRVVFATIHQPSSEVFHQLDKVLLLSRGRVVYFGPVSEVVTHFAHLGHPCPEHYNPADFVMDVMSSDYETATRTKEQAERDVEGLVESYAKHDVASAVRANIARSVERAQGAEAEAERAEADAPDYNVGFGKQVYELTRRGFLDVMRNPGIVWVRLVLYAMLSLMIGSLYFQLGDGQLDVTDKLSLLFYIVSFEAFMSIAAAPFFIEMRPTFERERANGFYSPGAYVLAQAVTSVPAIFLIALVSSGIVVPMVGLNGFGVFTVNLFCTLLAAETLIQLISAVVSHYVLALALGACAYGAFMLTQGFLRLPSELPAYWSWLRYLTMHYWSFRISLYNEFDGQAIECDRPIGVDAGGNPICTWGSGDDVTKLYEVDGVNVGLEIAALLIMSVVYRLIFWGVLYKFHTGKK